MTNIHPLVLDEMVRQHREDLINEAKLWSRVTRTRRARRRHRDE
jgi:hypothetical protein